MKNKILSIIVLITTFLGILTVDSFASFSSNDPTVTSGNTISITVKSSENLQNYDLALVSHTGLTYVSCSANENAAVNSAEGKISYATLGAGTTTLGTYTFKAPEVSQNTTYKVVFDINGTKNTSTVTVKAKETPKPDNGNSGNTGNTENNGGSTGGNTTPTVKEPTFTSTSKTVYAIGEINLRSSWSTSSQATKVSKGTEMLLTGTSKEKINGYVWYRVTYNGKIKYVSSSLITETKPEEQKPEETQKSNNANLKTLKVGEVELTPAFSADVTAYSVELTNYKENEIKVVAEAEDEKATVKVEGNEKITVGENVITVTVNAEDGTSKVYTITVTNKEASTFGLSSLKIKDVELKDFKTDKFEYSVDFKGLEKLEIEAVANQEGATVEILGNEELKDGENIITIIVTSANGEETVTYQIKANKLTVIEQQENKQFDMKTILISALIALIILVIIIILITKYVKRNDNGIDYMYEDNLEKDEDFKEENINADTENKQDEEIAEEITPKLEKKKPSIDDLYSDFDDEMPKKRGKGKHSK